MTCTILVEHNPVASLEIEPWLAEVGAVIKNWLGISWLAQSAFQASFADQTELGIEDQADTSYLVP